MVGRIATGGDPGRQTRGFTRRILHLIDPTNSHLHWERDDTIPHRLDWS